MEIVPVPQLIRQHALMSHGSVQNRNSTSFLAAEQLRGEGPAYPRSTETIA